MAVLATYYVDRDRVHSISVPAAFTSSEAGRMADCTALESLKYPSESLSSPPVVARKPSCGSVSSVIIVFVGPVAWAHRAVDKRVSDDVTSLGKNVHPPAEAIPPR